MSSRVGSSTSAIARTAPPPKRGARPSVLRQLLGLAVLVLAVIPGYVAARRSGAQEIPPPTNAPAPASLPLPTNDPTDIPAILPEVVESPPTEMGIDSHIREVAARYGISPRLIVAVIEVESQFNSRAVSRRGARGLMQLMPSTAATLGVRDLFDPRENIEAGVRHLRGLMIRFDANLPLVLAAYNAGEQAVIAYRGVPPYRETREYVRQVLRRLNNDQAKTHGKDRRVRTKAAARANRGQATALAAL